MYRKLALLFLLAVLLSGCIGLGDRTYSPESDSDSGASGTAVETPLPDTPVVPVTETSTPAPTPVPTPESETHRFISWLKEDKTNEHPYIDDPTKIYGEQYVCSQFTNDFIMNATDAGFEVYSAGLTGAVSGQTDWHMLAAVVVDGKLFFVDPQNDNVFRKEDMFHAYGYEYAYFGKSVYLGRNGAEISEPIRYHSVIGLNGDNFVYLK
jgi:hypothetical protein